MPLAALWGVFGAIYLLFAIDELGSSPAAIGLIAAVGGAQLARRRPARRRAPTRRFGVGPVVLVAAWSLVTLGNAFIPLAPAGAPFMAAPSCSASSSSATAR